MFKDAARALHGTEDHYNNRLPQEHEEHKLLLCTSNTGAKNCEKLDLGLFSINNNNNNDRMMIKNLPFCFQTRMLKTFFFLTWANTVTTVPN